jgi:hypothetical protein
VSVRAVRRVVVERVWSKPKREGDVDRPIGGRGRGLWRWHFGVGSAVGGRGGW